MKPNDKKAWMEKNKKLNENIELQIGMEVKDVKGLKGIIVKIKKWDGELTDENHGTVYVWQSEQTGYGGDNCEHYSLTNWKEFLRLTDESYYQENKIRLKNK